MTSISVLALHTDSGRRRTVHMHFIARRSSQLFHVAIDRQFVRITAALVRFFFQLESLHCRAHCDRKDSRFRRARLC